MNEFRFAQIGWLHATWAVIAFTASLVVLELRGRSILDRMLSPLMQTRLVYRTSLFRRMTAIGLIAAAMLAMVVAMMRPQWGMTVQATSRVDSQIMVCLDVSKSMLAEDAVPNRLDRAKAELDSLLGLMDEGQQVGLTAFAGKASVVCPMTTDFGFLRLVLQEVGPGTVGLGGTKIGEALQKAVDGFGDAGDVNRLILLITDGEDHDSFPLDAAKVARERGIRIVSIGFGDEAGSKIEVTDPETGARSFLKDRNGDDVISQLDGETLREIALETEGAYIPAGTGALDLESIYQAHIDTLLKGTTDAEQRVIRNEAYQWCVLVAIILLVAGLLTTSSLSLKSKALSESESRLAVTLSKAAVLILAITIFHPITALAQSEEDTSGNEKASDKETSDKENMPNKDEEEEELSPRGSYNKAVAFISRDPDRAERLLNEARRDAGVDGELRFRSLYNLGWVEVNRADGLVKDEPQEALKHLEQAANRFREAIRVRPESKDARHNLEIVSRRILELTDSLAKKDKRNLETRLDELIEKQRKHQSELRAIVSRVKPDDPNAEQHRRDFRRLGITQRKIISDMQKFADDARSEADAIKQKKAEEQSPEERVRAAQLSAMLRHVESSLQRMNKSRSLTRRMQGNRGFVRWSAALTDAKRGRDQLRNPIEVLGVLIQDTTELAGLTRAMAVVKSPQLEKKEIEAPAWLTKEYLQQTQASTTERTSELTAILSAGVEQHKSKPPIIGPQDPSKVDHQTQRLLANIESALPSMKKAEELFGEAGTLIEADEFAAALSKQADALVALNEAAEFFYDMRRLIEVIYGNEREIKTMLETLKSKPDLTKALVAAAKETQTKNNDRSARLDDMFDFELDQLKQSKPEQGPQPQPQQPNPEKQRLETAKQILQQVITYMSDAGKSLDEVSESGTMTDEVVSHVELTIEQLEELRRLFFSLVEHLRETAQRQADLNDNTNEISGKPDQQKPEKIGPLESRQRQLREVTEQIGQALTQQAEQATSAPMDQQSPEQAEQAKKAAQALGEAADLVGDAQNSMKQAASGLKTEDEEQIDFKPVGEHQQAALEKLVEALTLLDHSQQNRQNQNQQDNDQQNDQKQQDEQKKKDQQRNLDADQLLQLIRDREAQRRKDRRKANLAGSGVVDKDW